MREQVLLLKSPGLDILSVPQKSIDSGSMAIVSDHIAKISAKKSKHMRYQVISDAFGLSPLCRARPPSNLALVEIAYKNSL